MTVIVCRKCKEDNCNGCNIYTLAEMLENRSIKSVSNVVDAMRCVEHIELTNKEREILIVMFKNMNEVLNLCDGYLDIHGESFSRNDLFDLAEKLGVEEY